MVAMPGTFGGRFVAQPIEVDPDLMMIIPGRLQLAILSALWGNPHGLSLNRLHKIVNERYKIVALTTVSTTVIRLVRRGWIVRPFTGHYQAAVTRQDLIDQIAEYIEQA